jgi:4-aminobutyrate aminotransferase-like enzyme
VVAEGATDIADPELAATVRRIHDHFVRDSAPRLERLERGAIHGDLNDHNILVDRDGPLQHRVSGVVDLGDMVHSWVIADLAIAMAYVIAESDDPLQDAAAMVRGYDEIRPLHDHELAVLFPLALMRLCASATIAARAMRERPGNEYLGVTQTAIARTLPALSRIPASLAEVVLREACSRVPWPRGTAVAKWLRAQAREGRIHPVLGASLADEGSIVLDWSVASALLGADERENSEPEITRRVFGEMGEAGVKYAVGRYDEPRLLYVSAAFASGSGRLTEERRTVHIGIDLFGDAGTPVYAPLDGEIHAFADNDAPCDYGGVIILRHATDDGTPFFTLYGHLSRASLDGLEAGRRVSAGERIASFGTPEENGGWTPHLHLQIITDLMELGTDFPGVARPSQRAAWLALCPDPNIVAGVPQERFPEPARSFDATLAARRASMGASVRLSYARPVRVARGWMQYLFDDEGRRYVDAYNNVPHVGHCHPHVVSAIADQARVLNTNTRYLTDVVVRYVERLVALFPEPLSVCYFLSSASEANELALRLARAHTRATDTIVLDAAYHGNTTTLIDISPYKHSGPGGDGTPDWVHVAPIPDVYRMGADPADATFGPSLALHVGRIVERLAEHSVRPAAFIAETCPSVGGQVLLPNGYLASVYASVRGAGGVCIADEVQTGLGRTGSHMWAFQAHDVVPDIVVLGKPLGNGMPLAAVVTTRAIAESFDNGMEYFSTFGGNTVSCAAGLAVLDVLEAEGLQAHAQRVGAQLLDGCRAVMARREVIGDVRGSGLFIGVELVRDRASRTPAPMEASFVVERMRERGVLVGTDGPHHNVIKVRPPMPFADADAELLVAELDRALALLR